VVRELIQAEANPVMIADEIGLILTDAGYAGAIREKLAAIRGRLGGGGASANVARLILATMEG
jgi:lipid-A-disaccharide synthase